MPAPTGRLAGRERRGRRRWMERIEADLLIPGNGEPVREGVVVWDGPTITYAGPAADAPSTPQAPSTQAAAVLPGLWDCHGHLLGARALDLTRLVLEPLALRAARCAGDLRAALDAGVTSVREVGGLGVYLARAVEEGSLDGPSIYGAGAILSVTGGHGDLHSLPCPGWRSSGSAGASSGCATGWTAVSRPCVSSCATTPG